MCRNVFIVWPKTTLLPVWRREEARRLDTPAGPEKRPESWTRPRSVSEGGAWRCPEISAQALQWPRHHMMLQGPRESHLGSCLRTKVIT